MRCASISEAIAEDEWELVIWHLDLEAPALQGEILPTVFVAPLLHFLVNLVIAVVVELEYVIVLSSVVPSSHS